MLPEEFQVGQDSGSWLRSMLLFTLSRSGKIVVSVKAYDDQYLSVYTYHVLESLVCKNKLHSTHLD